MILYTLQQEYVTKQILQGQPYLATEPADSLQNNAYQWFQRRAKFQSLPIFAFSQFPDNEFIQHWIKQQSMTTELLFLLEIKIPNYEKIIFSHAQAWDYVLNYWLLDSCKGIEAFNKLCRDCSVNYLTQQPIDHPFLHDKIKASWNKIFDINWCNEHLGQSPIQVCIQSIHPQWLRGYYTINKETKNLQYCSVIKEIT